jgi:hypothetical protein
MQPQNCVHHCSLGVKTAKKTTVTGFYGFYGLTDSDTSAVKTTTNSRYL